MYNLYILCFNTNPFFNLFLQHNVNRDFKDMNFMYSIKVYTEKENVVVSINTKNSYGSTTMTKWVGLLWLVSPEDDAHALCSESAHHCGACAAEGSPRGGGPVHDILPDGRAPHKGRHRHAGHPGQREGGQQAHQGRHIQVGRGGGVSGQVLLYAWAAWHPLPFSHIYCLISECRSQMGWLV